MYTMRKLSTGRYDDRGYSNEESIANLQLTRPVELNAFLTYNYGMDSDRFPLSFMTEGQGSRGITTCKTVQWTWKTMGRMKFTDYVTYFNTANIKPGIGGTEFEVHFASHWFIEQYGLLAPDGITQVRIQKDCGQSAYGYKYILVCTNPDPNFFIDPDLLTKGKYWSLTAPTVSESYSKGNRSNSMGPGEMTSQLEFFRYSKEIAGNLANTVTQYEFIDENGASNKLWINEEMRQFNLNMRVMNEERLWLHEYNRLPDGTVKLIDRDNGKPIYQTAGMLEICRESNYDTYGEYLTLTKLERTIGDVLNKDTDDGTMDVVLMGGKGFIQDFQLAVENDARAKGFVTPLGEKKIMENGDGLAYGKYFNQYKTPDGHTITVKHCAFFDHGTPAEAAKQNGMIHPRTGLPITSHQACLIDMSSYKGVQNVRIVKQAGQEYMAKVIEGMTPIPASWGIPSTGHAATDVDMARYEIKGSMGLQVNNTTKMFLLKCVL